jgi:hypothetical protein
MKTPSTTSMTNPTARLRSPIHLTFTLKGRPDDENAIADMEEVMTLCCPGCGDSRRVSGRDGEHRIVPQGPLVGGLSFLYFTT